MELYLSIGLWALGLAGAALAIAWPLQMHPDPFAEPFGEMPRLPDQAEEAERLWS